MCINIFLANKYINTERERETFKNCRLRLVRCKYGYVLLLYENKPLGLSVTHWTEIVCISTEIYKLNSAPTEFKIG